MTFISILETLSLLPGASGQSATSALSALDANAERRAVVERSIEAEKISARIAATTFDGEAAARAATNLANLEAELATLGPAYGSITYTVDAANDTIRKATEELLARMAGRALPSENTPPPGTMPVVPNSVQGFLGGLFQSAGSFLGGLLPNMSNGTSPLQIPEDSLFPGGETTMDVANASINQNIEGDWLARGMQLLNSGNSNPIAWRTLTDQFNRENGLNDNGWSVEDIKQGLELTETARELEQTRLATNQFLADPGAAFQSAWSLLGDTWNGIYAEPQQPDMAAQVKQLEAAMPAIGKALVGSYGDTQGNLLQMVPTMERLQEQANKHLEGIEEDMDALASNTQPFVFVA